MRVDGERMWQDLVALGQIGGPGAGVNRVAFSQWDMEGRKWLLGKLRDAGLSCHMDGWGNVFGSTGGAGPFVAVGSHIDTVPQGGMFDGALGVVAGLECLRTLKDSSTVPPVPLLLLAYSNEEGARGLPGMFGSRALFEGISDAELQQVLPVLTNAGLCPEPDAPPYVGPRDIRAYVELHVEQGGVLEATEMDIGVVTGITSLVALDITFVGEANHAGTTPMRGRKDALIGAARLIPFVRLAAGERGTVATCGSVEVSPGARNVIPGKVRVSLEARDMEIGVAEGVLGRITEEALRIGREEALQVHIGAATRTHGTKMDESIQDIIEETAGTLGYRHVRMPSGAGHDAMIVAKAVPSGMIFVPSIGGKSHSPDEATSKEDCERGAHVLLGTLLRLAGYTG